MISDSGKRTLRTAARGKRVVLASALPHFAERIAVYADALSLPDKCIVGAYVALPGEADPNLLLKRLAAKGHAIAFPRVAEKDAPLSFHLWRDGQQFKPGVFGIPEPAADLPLANPRVLLVPLLAFDSSGFRIGYGGGYYDRTLAGIRANGEITAIGIAYAGQEVDSVPRDVNDQRLDMVLTETGLKKFG
jgi:5-formyltetrahydrofolate cyclo-ligase